MKIRCIPVLVLFGALLLGSCTSDDAATTTAAPLDPDWTTITSDMFTVAVPKAWVEMEMPGPPPPTSTDDFLVSLRDPVLAQMMVASRPEADPIKTPEFVEEGEPMWWEGNLGAAGVTAESSRVEVDGYDAVLVIIRDIPSPGNIQRQYWVYSDVESGPELAFWFTGETGRDEPIFDKVIASVDISE